MPPHCPFCAAPLSPTGDAFCGECRGQLDEAPPTDLSPADLEIRRKIASGSANGMTRILLLVFGLLGVVWYALEMLFALFARR